MRARKSSACNAGTHGEVACRSFIERTTWDGDQIIIEKRTNGAEGLAGSTLDSGSGSSDAWGTVVSVHAHGIDQPVVVRNVGRTSIAPHANWMGDYQVGTTANGTVTTSCNGASDCPVLFWPGSKQTIDGLYTSHPSINTWWGSLITEKADPSGYKYMRNRYYNPQTGQFTQADPIGLGGGLNLYGFAAGDPVNFDDPFGLCEDPNDIACNLFESGMTALGATVGFIGGGGLGLIQIAGTGGLATPAAVATAMAGTAGGAAGGKAWGRVLSDRLFSKASSGARSGGRQDEPTAGEIISREKRGSINRVFPEHMRDKTRAEIEGLARKGDRAAQTAKKLLTDKRFNKEQ